MPSHLGNPYIHSATALCDTASLYVYVHTTTFHAENESSDLTGDSASDPTISITNSTTFSTTVTAMNPTSDTADKGQWEGALPCAACVCGMITGVH